MPVDEHWHTIFRHSSRFFLLRKRERRRYAMIAIDHRATMLSATITGYCSAARCAADDAAFWPRR